MPRVLRLCSRIFYGLSLGIATTALLSVFFVKFVYNNIQTIGVMLFGLFFLGLIMAAIHRMALNFERRSSCKGRAKTNINKFIEESHSLQRADKDFVKIARDVFGHIYGVDSKIILPSDTPDSLRMFGVVIDPFGFEVVMGISQRLNIIIQNDDIYKTVKLIYDNACSVEDVIVILAKEFGKTH